MGGLNIVFTKHTSSYSSMITKLLQKNVNVAEIEDVIDDMVIFEGYSSKEMKKPGLKVPGCNVVYLIC